MNSKIERKTDGTIVIDISIPWKKVQENYQKTVEDLGKEMEIKGFRKGKAPIALVEKSLKKSSIYEEILRNLIPEVYVEVVKANALKPIVNPQIKVISLEEGKDWEIQAMVCELPEVVLGDYKKLIAEETAGDKIWVPGKEEKQEDKEKTEDEKLQKIFNVLLKNAKITLPEMLASEEVNRMLSRLIEQTEKLGITVEQYLVSVGKTSEQVKEEYRHQAEETLELELILGKIADLEGIKVEDEEVEKMLAAVPDEKSRESLNSPSQTAYLKQLLRKRKVIDLLLKENIIKPE